MEFINRQVCVCLVCMEYHMVYWVRTKNKEAEYCYKDDMFIQHLSEDLMHEDII